MNRSSEERLLAARQMGEFLKAMPKAKGTREQLAGPGKIGGAKKDPPISTLADIGITKKQSATTQKLAAIPEPEFRRRLEAGKSTGLHRQRPASRNE